MTEDINSVNGKADWGDGDLYESDMTPLHFSAKAGLLSVVQRMMSSLDEKFPLDKNKNTPLYHAVIGGKVSPHEVKSYWGDCISFSTN